MAIGCPSVEIDMGTHMIRALIEPIVLALCDGEPVNLSRADPRGTKRALRATERASALDAAKLQEWVSLKEFLAACHRFTAEEVREHLIVGYGFRGPRTTEIDRIHHVPGEARRVEIPPEMVAEVRRHHAHRTDAEVIVFHNHPRTGYEAESFYWIKALVDDLPMASPRDRDLLQELSFNPLGLLRHALNDGRVLFYLGESGYVGRIKLPNLLSLLERGLKLS
jgi:hypothetical protein